MTKKIVENKKKNKDDINIDFFYFDIINIFKPNFLPQVLNILDLMK